jgi:hypothetical protein
MRTSTATFLLLAVVVLVLGGSLMSNYPAALPVVGADGSPMIGSDGQPIFRRDMTEYYRLNAPAFTLLGCSAFLFAWCLARAVKYLNECFSKKTARNNCRS